MLQLQMASGNLQKGMKWCRNGAEMVEIPNNLSQADADEAEPQDGNAEDGDGEDASEATGRTGRSGRTG